MIAVIGTLLALVISLLWYMPGIKAQGDRQVLKRNDYLRAALVYGLAFSCVLIIATEIAFDAAAEAVGLKGLSKSIIEDFFRAALLEESFKFWGFRLAKGKLGLRRKIDYVMIAGLIGLTYGVVEKAVTGNVAGIIVGPAIPMHIMWQFNQGGHYYEYEQLKAAGQPAAARKEWFLAMMLPFVFHGCWDSGLDIIVYSLDQKETTLQVLGGVLLIVMVVLGVLYCVRTLRRVIRLAKEAQPLTV